MTDHPNYKYRPRRRKHTKARAGTNQSAAQNNLVNHPATPNDGTGGSDSPYNDSNGIGVESTRMSPYTYNMYYAAGATGNSAAAVAASAATAAAVAAAAAPASATVLHTPDSSPTQSPEPSRQSTPRCRTTGGGGRNTTKLNSNATLQSQPPNNSNNTAGKHVVEVDSLPTPDMSPMEMEKESYSQSMISTRSNGMGSMLKKHSGNYLEYGYQSSKDSDKMSYGSHIFDHSSVDVDPHLKREYISYDQMVEQGSPDKRYGSPYDIPSSTDRRSYICNTTATTLAAGKGMYVTSTGRGLLDQGNVVRGTYFPPLATSQDHQNLGTVTSSASASILNYAINGNVSNGSNSNSNPNNNNNNNNPNQHNNNDNNHSVNKDSHQMTTAVSSGVMDVYGYSNPTVSMPIATYAHHHQYKDYSNSSSAASSQSNAGATNACYQSTPMMEDIVDTREFDKYLKYPDPNHNYNIEYDAYHHHNNYVYHHHHQSTAAAAAAAVAVIAANGGGGSGGQSHLIAAAHHPHQDYYQLYHHQSSIAPMVTANGSPSVSTVSAKMDTMLGTVSVAGSTVAAGVYPAILSSVAGVSSEVFAVPVDSMKDDDFSNILAGVRKTCYSN